jgi:hypothetical protein
MSSDIYWSWDTESGRLVVWDTPASGDVMAPFNDPVSNLDLVWLCSDFDYYQVAFDQSVTLSHPSVSGANTSFATIFTIAGHYVESDLAVLTHNLGYIPRFKVAIGAELIPNGWAIQTPAGGDNGARLVSFYATTTEIRCRDMGWATSSTLAAKSQTYEIVVFETPTADRTLPVFDGQGGSPTIGVFCQGIFDGRKEHLRRAASGESSPFDILTSKAGDINFGAYKMFTGDGTSKTFGSYGGSLTAPSSIQCVLA